MYEVIYSGRGIMSLFSSGFTAVVASCHCSLQDSQRSWHHGTVLFRFTEVIRVLSQEASREFTLSRMKHVCINVILCFCLSESDNAQENRTDFKCSVNSSSDSENKMLYTLRV